MTETGVLVQNCRLFRANFDDRQLFVKHMQKHITLCHCDYLEDIYRTFPYVDLVVELSRMYRNSTTTGHTVRFKTLEMLSGKISTTSRHTGNFYD